MKLPQPFPLIRIVLALCFAAAAQVQAAAPQMQSLTVNPAAAMSNQTITFTGRATDADGNLNSLSFYFTGPGNPGWNFFAGVATSNGSDDTKSVTWTAPGDGDYAVTCQAWDSDGNPNGDSYATFHVGNRAPNAVSLDVNPSPAVVGQSVTFTGHVTDADGNLSSMSFYINGPGYPGWNILNNVDASGTDDTKTISWTPPSAGEWQVHLQPWDAAGTGGTRTTPFTVNSNNTPPNAQSLLISPSPAGPGQQLTLTGRATDADGNLDSLSFYYSGPNYPGWNILTNVGTSNGSDDTKSVTWTPPGAGTWLFHLQPWDQSGTTGDSRTTEVTVANRAPDFAQIALTGGASTITIGNSITLQGTLHDPDGNLQLHDFFYKLPGQTDWLARSAYPSGWSNNSNTPPNPSNGTTSVISSTFTPNQTGVWTFHANGYDSEIAVGPGDTLTVTVNEPANQPPSTNVSIQFLHPETNGALTTVSASAVEVGDIARITSTATDAENRLLTHLVHIKRPEIPAQLTDLAGSTTDLFGHSIAGYGQAVAARWNLPTLVDGNTEAGDWGIPPDNGGETFSGDVGNRSPWSDAPGGSPSIRVQDLVLDAPGDWVIRTTTTTSDSPAQSAESTTSIHVNMPVLPTSVSTYPRSGETLLTDKMVGVYYNTGQPMRGFPSQGMWSRVWQPAGATRWNAKWGAHAVYPILPGTAQNTASILSHDVTSVEAARRMATRLMDVGVDFVVVDHTNRIFFQDNPLDDDVLKATADLITGFQDKAINGRAVRATILLGMTMPWEGIPYTDKIGVFNAKLKYIYETWAQYPEKWVQLDGKPLLLLFTAQEGPWLTPNGRHPGTDQFPWESSDQTAANWGHLKSEYLDAMKFTTGGTEYKMTEKFTIRYVGSLLTDAEPYANLTHYAGTYTVNGVAGTHIKTGHWIHADGLKAAAIKPVDLNNTGNITSVEAVTVRAAFYTQFKDPATFASDLAAAKAMNPQFLLVTAWNEFGSLNDEPIPERSWTVMDNNKFGTLYARILKEAIAGWH